MSLGDLFFSTAPKDSTGWSRRSIEPGSFTPARVIPPAGGGHPPAGQPQREPDPHRARADRTGGGSRHQRPQAGRGRPQASRGPIQQPRRIDRSGRVGDSMATACSRCSARPSRRSRAGNGDDWIGRPFEELLHPDDVDDRAFADTTRRSRVSSLPHFELRIRTRSGDYLNCEFLLVTRFGGGPGSDPGHLPRHHRTAAVRANARAGRVDAPGQGSRPSRPAAPRASSCPTSVTRSAPRSAHCSASPSSWANIHTFTGGPAEIQEYLGQSGRMVRCSWRSSTTCWISRGSRPGSFGSCAKPAAFRRSFPTLVESFRGQGGGQAPEPGDPSSTADVPRSIATDRLRIQQILMNLLDNAIKFTEQGTIRLTARVLELEGCRPRPSARGAAIPASA